MPCSEQGALAWHWIGLVIVSASALTLFAKVGEDVADHESTSFDGAIRGWMLAHQSPIFFQIFLFITWLGSTIVIGPFAVVTGLWLWRRKGRRVAAAVVTAPAVAATVFVIIKDGFRRVRPIGALRLHQTTYAFPSGHATTAVAVLVTVAYVLARESLLRKQPAMLLATIGPLLIGISRLYLDVHWATDVAGGWAAGLVVATLCGALYERLRPREARPNPAT